MKSQGSPNGYHFITEWRTCPRKWFIHHVAGLESMALKAAPSIGSIVHALQESFFMGGYRDLSNEYADEVSKAFSDYTDAFFEEEELVEAKRKVRRAFIAWRNIFGQKDLEDYEIVGIEIPIKAALPSGVEVTGRLDRLMRDKSSGELTIFDTKTTSWGPEGAHKKMELGDQATMYTWLVQKQYGLQPVAIIPDILYLKPREPVPSRHGVIRRSKSDVEGFILGLCKDWGQLRHDLHDYETGLYPEHFLFPRHSTVCSEFGCEYEDLCRVQLDETSPSPQAGYERKEAVTEATLFSTSELDKSPIIP